MTIMLEIQLDNVKHHLVMQDLATAELWLDKLEPHVGVRFKNDRPDSMRITSVDGQIIVALEHIVSVRVSDGKLYQDGVSEERIAEREEFANIFRKVDGEIWEKIVRELKQ